MPDRTDAVHLELARLIAAVLDTEPDRVTALPLDTPLLTGELGLSSRTGAQLLVAVHRRFGVDVADEDLALTSLASIGSLAAFIRDRVA